MKPVPNQLPASDPGTVRLALVGEAPGAEEAAQCRPFCGPSGWQLNNWLAAAGLARSACFVGNVAQVRPSPTSNEFHLFDWNGPRVQEGIAALREDLARFRPNVVVALGNAALHLLRHGNVAPPKSRQRQLFQWTSHVGTWRGSLFLGARSFDAFEAADLRAGEAQRGLSSGGSGQDHAALGTPGVTAKAGAAPAPDATLSNGEAIGAGVCIAGSAPRAAGLPTPLAGGERRESAGVVAPREAHGITPPATPLGGTDPCGGVYDNALGKAQHGGVWKCLSTYHPAATFREPSFTYPLVSDLKRAVAEARSPRLELPRRNIVWSLSVDEIAKWCAAICARREAVGFDIEGGLGGLQCCSFAVTPHDAFVIDLMDPTLDRPRLLRAIAAILEDPQVPKVCWNAAYERAVLQATHSITMRGYEDGMLAWWERFSELPKGLDFVASLLTREPYWAEGIGWDKRTGAPKVTGPRFWRYNGTDSCVTLEIWQHSLVRAVAESRTPVAFAL